MSAAALLGLNAAVNIYSNYQATKAQNKAIASSVSWNLDRAVEDVKLERLKLINQIRDVRVRRAQESGAIEAAGAASGVAGSSMSLQAALDLNARERAREEMKSIVEFRSKKRNIYLQASQMRKRGKDQIKSNRNQFISSTLSTITSAGLQSYQANQTPS